jgi:hypothetical protein
VAFASPVVSAKRLNVNVWVVLMVLVMGLMFGFVLNGASRVVDSFREYSVSARDYVVLSNK